MLLIIGAPDPMVFCPPGNSTGSPLMCIELPSFRRISLPLGPHRYTKNPQESLDYPLPWATCRRHLSYECLSPDYFSCPGRPQLHFPHKTVAPKSAIKGNCRDLPRNIHVTKALVKGGLEQHSRVCSAGEDQSGIRCKQNLGKKSVRRERERRGREGCGSNRGNSGRTWGRGGAGCAERSSSHEGAQSHARSWLWPTVPWDAGPKDTGGLAPPEHQWKVYSICSPTRTAQEADSRRKSHPLDLVCYYL